MKVVIFSLVVVSSCFLVNTQDVTTNPPPHKDDRCPAEDPGSPVYLPDLYDCKKYYECNSGWAYQFTCPGVLVFNPDLNICDSPQNVDCSGRTGTPPPNTTQPPASTTQPPASTTQPPASTTQEIPSTTE